MGLEHRSSFNSFPKDEDLADSVSAEDTLREEERVTMLRKASDEVFTEKAHDRNERRALLARLFGIKKVTGPDLLREEADRVNMLTDMRRADMNEAITTQESADEIGTSAEFEIPDRSTRNVDMMVRADAIERQHAFSEMLRTKHPGIETQIELGDLSGAVMIVRDASARTPDPRIYPNALNEVLPGLKEMVAAKIETMELAHDQLALRRLAANSPEDLALLVNDQRFATLEDESSARKA